MHSANRFPARRSRRGNSMVEFTLVFLVFLLVVVGTIEFSRAIWTFNTIAHAARHGARFAMIRGSNNPATADQVSNAVRGAIVGLVNPGQVEVTTAWPSGVARGNPVRVRVSYPFGLVTGTLLLSQTTIQMAASSEVILAN